MNVRRAGAVALTAVLIAGCGEQGPGDTVQPDPTTPETTSSAEATTLAADHPGDQEEAPAEPTATEAAPPASATSSAPTPTEDAASTADETSSLSPETAEILMLSALDSSWDEHGDEDRLELCEVWADDKYEIVDIVASELETFHDSPDLFVTEYFDEACEPVLIAAEVDRSDTSSYKDLSRRDWAQVVKDPDSYVGDRYVLFGHVSQFDAATGRDAFLADTDAVWHAKWYDYEHNTLVMGDESLFDDVVKDDFVTMHVEVRGSISYDTQIGGNTTVPLVNVYMIEVTGSSL